MTRISVLGTGAFGTALAIALSRDGTPVTLWGRDGDDLAAMAESRKTGRALPDIELPDSLTLSAEIPDADIALIAVPAQAARGFLEGHASALTGQTLITCAKGIERSSGLGPVDVVRDVLPGARAGCLTGPSFATDIARGLPTALVLAMSDGAKPVQEVLNRPLLRIYRSDDTAGAQLGGASKNVIAIAAGIAIGAGLGDSARASVIARGFAEMVRYATARGALPETLQGLAGLGDLVLTCTSEKSRNFAAGLALGRGEGVPEGVTVEGLATAIALAEETAREDIDMPLAQTVALVAEGRLTIDRAIEALLARPPGKE
ncbi:NAD(P)H-dependent glycerol-3-phosphate dehydrogenase [Alphaproteobacteria bacterium GH1-50]|uniref:Glycerol-3-phosphate dehydrogenase [NAD(P)+] n=1 Tax=Kangsaoukella pontilimi TaxID=2691042 RepID=A0A7C9MGA2_9RHOB|nr:NAD(P)H-dependent glycerol-3-phosphate dehydrogenase [Kangsaoukella pontilimi]MXQ08216.1 NAD(P)H-dependent glycerol-3-phosphate dehydrogenase [Kangsaoukella pontilimi]